MEALHYTSRAAWSWLFPPSGDMPPEEVITARCVEQIIADMTLPYEPHNTDAYIGNMLSQDYNIPIMVGCRLTAIMRLLAATEYWYPNWDVDAYLLLDTERSAAIRETPCVYRYHICPKGKRWLRYLYLLEATASNYAHLRAHSGGLDTFLQLPIVSLCLQPTLRTLWVAPDSMHSITPYIPELKTGPILPLPMEGPTEDYILAGEYAAQDDNADFADFPFALQSVLDDDVVLPPPVTH